jgi:hypothetical protein
MSSSVSEAAAHLKKPSTRPEGGEEPLLWAYTDNGRGPKYEYLVLDKDGNVAAQRVSGVAPTFTSKGVSPTYKYQIVGIALKFISLHTDDTTVNKLCATWAESQLVADLRVAMNDGTIAPPLHPSSSK